MNKKSIKIIVHASVGWSDYPGMKKALRKLLQPVSGPLFEIEIVTVDGPGASKLPGLWAAEMGYSVVRCYARPGWPFPNLEAVQYCMFDPDAKLIIFTRGYGDDLNLITYFKDLIGESNIMMITI